MKRLLITGAAGALGTQMRHRLADMAEVIRLADVRPVENPGANEEVMQVELGDRDAVQEMVRGCDGIVHMGGIPNEQPFDVIYRANMLGMQNLYAAAHDLGQPRILFGSSNHTVGFYPQDRRLTVDSATWPDGLYGVSKCFGEQIARLYFDKHGQESALVRIGSCREEPVDYRGLSTWLSYGDLALLARRVFATPRLGCPVIWGVSANDAAWWDNSHIAWLGWHPQDNAENWRARIEATVVSPKEDAMQQYQGGSFVPLPIGGGAR